MLEQLIDLDTRLTLALNGSTSLYLDGLAVTLTATLTWLPAALVLLYVLVKNNDTVNLLLTLLTLALCILVADQVASSVFKPLVARYRPSNDPALMHIVDIVDGYRGGRYGFFSSHAANTFAVATCLGLIVRHRGLTFMLVAWALVNCWTRLYLGVHYVGDLLCGTIWGVFTGWALHLLYARLAPARTKRVGGGVYTPGGYAVSDARLLVAALLTILLPAAFVPWLWALA